MVKVPSIPPLSSVSDPNARAVLQAMVDQSRIRNGEVGGGKERFVTVGELQSGLTGAQRIITGGASSSQSGLSSTFAGVFQSISSSIMQSKPWKYLDEAITRIERPEWFNRKFGTAITTEQVAREKGDYSLAQRITTFTASFGNSLAGIQEELTATATASSALAQSTTTAIAEVNSNIGLVQQRVQAASDLAGAAASSVTQLQAKVGQVDSAAQEALSLAASVEGTVDGMWSVKFDVNGYVAGVALGVTKQQSGPPKSAFVVRADTFAVGSPGAQDVVPFIVEDGVVYMNTAVIRQASIGNAQIDRLTVNKLTVLSNDIAVGGVSTGNIQLNAATAPAFVSALSSDVSLQYTLTGNASEHYSVFILGSVVQSYASEIFLTVNGVQQWRETPSDGTLATRGHVLLLAPGQYAIRIYSTDSRNINGSSLYVLATKR